ncbi:MAG TPA: PIG-L family deacetylase [Chloroflexota bacterium]|nr:PIG-L family deacetylase [Chloroflexota bacterium]
MDLGRTLLAVHAHPDDESITTGGLLAWAHAQGVRTIVVTSTGGDIGPRRAPLEGQLVDIRDRELAEALRILGVSRGVRLGYRDSGLLGWPDNDHPASFHAAPLDQAAARLAEILDEERPETVVTYAPDGGYGHPDHVKAYHVAAAACRLVQPPPALYAVVFPRRWLRAFEQLTGARGPALLGVDDMDPPPNFGTAAECEALDVRAYVETKRAAIAAHRSQMGDDHVLVRMPPEVYREVWSREHYQRLDL